MRGSPEGTGKQGGNIPQDPPVPVSAPDLTWLRDAGSPGSWLNISGTCSVEMMSC